MRSLMMVGAALMATAGSAGAQIIRPVSYSRPIAWTSASIGYLEQQTICDPGSNACWNFGSAPQYRASIEKPMGDAGTYGLSATFADMPLIWATSSPSLTSCSRCDANVQMTQYFALMHLGAGSGFQQVIDLSAGATIFRGFAQTSGEKLGNGKAVTDFSFAVAYGFGYGVSSRLNLYLVQEYGLVIHKRQPGSSNNSAQQRTLRVGARLALGEARR